MRRTILMMTGLLTFAATASAYEPNDWQQNAATLLGKEPKVIESRWMQDISLWVGVRDDGSDRSGYASYICTVLKDAGMPANAFVVIRVLDQAALARNKMHTVGQNICGDPRSHFKKSINK